VRNGEGRKVKHGIVTNGKTTTYYGNAATTAMARMMASHCFSQEEAREAVERSCGELREALIEALVAKGYVFKKKWLDELREKEKKEEGEARERARARHRAKYREFPVETRTTRSKCRLCRNYIRKGEPYHDGGVRGGRAHARCVEEPGNVPNVK